MYHNLQFTCYAFEDNMPKKIRNRKRSKLQNGVVHSFNSNTSSSKRTVYSKHVINQSVSRSVGSDTTNTKGLKSVYHVEKCEKSSFERMKSKHVGKNIFFSAKLDSNDDVELLGDGVWVNINNNEAISLIDTTQGMVCYDKNTSDVVFVLLNRQNSIQFRNPDKFIQALEHVEAKKPPKYSCRGSKRKVVFEDGQEKTNYVTVGVAPNRGGKGLYKKGFVDEQHQCTLDKMTAFIENKCSVYIDKKVKKAWRGVHQAIGLNVRNIGPLRKRKKPIDDECEDGEIIDDSNKTVDTSYTQMCKLFPSMATGRNTCLQMHTDEDAFLSVVCVYRMDDIEIKRFDRYKNGSEKPSDVTVSRIKMKCDVLKYFTFSSGVSVALRTGDILMFNPQIDHCISSNTDACKNSDVFCTSHYFKSMVIGLNDNSLLFDEDAKK